MKESYENWTCGDENCVGLCIGAFLTDMDMFSLLRPDVQNDVPCSSVLVVHAMNPETGEGVEDYDGEAGVEFALELDGDINEDNETVEVGRQRPVI